MTSARLGADPFPLTADPRAYVPRAASESALRALERALFEGRCGVLTGPTGVGKTTLLHVLDARLGMEVRSVYVPNGSLELDDVCRWALGMLGESNGDNPCEALLGVARQLGDDGRLLLLLLDDASEPVFGAARSLMALSEKAGGALRLILVPAKTGYDPRLTEALGAWAARVDFSAPMTATETAELVHSHLASIGLPKDLRARFDAATIDRIHRAASGNARLVGLVASEILWPDRPGQGVGAAVAPQSLAPPGGSSRIGPTETGPVVLPEESPSAATAEAEPVALPEEGLSAAPAQAEPVALPGETSSAGSNQAKPAAAEKRPRSEDAVPAPLNWPSRRLRAHARPAALASLGLVLLLAGIAALLLLPPSEEPSSSHSVLASDTATGVHQREEGASIAEQQLVLAVPASAKETLQLRGEAQPEGGAGPRFVDTTEPEGARPPEVAEPPVPSSVPDPRPRLARQEPSDRVPLRATAKVETPRPKAAMPTGVAPVAKAPAPPVTETAKVAIYVNATPWAHIEMDGKALGATPLGDVPVAPGQHHFRALLPDGRQIERTVLISQEERRVIFSADSGSQSARLAPPDPAALKPQAAVAVGKPVFAAPAPSEEAPDPRGQARSEDGAAPDRETPGPAVAPSPPSASVAKAPAAPVTETAKVLIFINATPWAQVEMDGEKLGVTPLGNVPVSPGEHHFRALLPDGRQIERTVLVSREARHFGFSPDPGDR